MLNKERPRVDEKHTIHHHHNETVPEVRVVATATSSEFWPQSNLQSPETSGLSIFEVECVWEYMAASIFSKDYGSLPPRANLTIEAPNAGLSDNTVELWFFGILSTDVSDDCTTVTGNKARLISCYWPTALCQEERSEVKVSRCQAVSYHMMVLCMFPHLTLVGGIGRRLNKRGVGSTICGRGCLGYPFVGRSSVHQ